MISFNQTKNNPTKGMQRRLGLVGLTAGAALAVTTLSAIANPQSLEKSPSMSGSSQSQQPTTETPVTPTAQAPGPSTPVPTTPSPTIPRLPTTPTVPNTPGMTVPTNPAPTAPMQASPTSPTSPVTRPTTPGTTPSVTPGTAPGTAPGASAAPTTPAKPAAQTPASPTAPRTSAAPGTIADVAAANSTFKTLVSALNEAELTEVLKGQGPFTVFAPTDAAFNALPAGTVDELMKPENRTTLVQLLKYHVGSGAYPSSRLTAGQLPSTEGSPITVTVADGKMKVNDANVMQPDIMATNGVIHAIDQVILPPSR